MKIWQIKDRPKSLVLSDAELIAAIKQGLLRGDDVLIKDQARQMPYKIKRKKIMKHYHSILLFLK